MKIATWNVQRPHATSKTRNQKIINALQRVDADIVILTENHSLINLGPEYTVCSTTSLDHWPEPTYKPGENRTTIFTKYPVLKQLATYDAFTAVCAVIQTPLRELTVYGTIIGIHGNRRASFNVDLEQQVADWKTLATTRHLCLAGDFNISFADNYYFTHHGRNIINKVLEELHLENLTAHIPQNIDHIAISQSFVKSAQCKVTVWNEDKSLSDHIGVCVQF